MNNINQTVAVTLEVFLFFLMQWYTSGQLRKYNYTSQENQTHFAIYNVVFTTNVERSDRNETII